MSDESTFPIRYSDMTHKSFRCMGTQIGFWIDVAAGDRARAAISAGEKLLHDFDRRLSRFREDSELCRLNADPRDEVEVSALLTRLVVAALDAARDSGGLVDPTLVDAIENVGYRTSLSGVTPASLAEALASHPPVARAFPDPAARWREIEVDLASRTIRRPHGVRIDSGGCGKGLAADMVAQIWSQLLPRDTRFVVDCGGDIRVNALPVDVDPYEIDVETEQIGPGELTLTMHSGAVATSGIDSRLWRRDDGSYAHHVIDPATGSSAWTGLTSVTAIGPTALEAETIAKTALLMGPAGSRQVLAVGGGATVDYDGKVEVIPPSPAPARPATDYQDTEPTENRKVMEEAAA